MPGYSLLNSRCAAKISHQIAFKDIIMVRTSRFESIHKVTCGITLHCILSLKESQLVHTNS